MPLIQWEDRLSVGVEQIDNDHKLIIRMINKAYDSSKVDHETLQELINDMRTYALNHFATETSLMKKYGYPETDRHLRQHKDFVMRAVVTSSLDATKDWSLDAVKVFQYLSDWVDNHILVEDKKLGRYLNEHGVY